jgi:hypothetical protein
MVFVVVIIIVVIVITKNSSEKIKLQICKNCTFFFLPEMCLESILRENLTRINLLLK